MVTAAYGLAEAGNQRFAVSHPHIKQVSTLPFWLVKLLSILTRNQELASAGELMAYFDKVGEGNNPARIDGMLRAPRTTLDSWLERKKQDSARQELRASVDHVHMPERKSL